MMTHASFVFFAFCHILPARASEAVADAASCETPTVHGQSEAGQAMMQIKAQQKIVDTEVSPVNASQCPLPAGAVWCEVRLQNIQPYWMAVYANADVVSANVCTKGHWEDDDFSAFGPPGHMIDVGGNIGYMTYAFAAAGWTVTSFEPMAPNLALQDATRCQNPTLAAKVTLNRHGLGTQAQECKMIAPVDNVGDGFTRCTGDAATPLTDWTNFKEIGQFAVKRLDEALVEQNVSAVDVMKIDVEGYEPQVFAGAPRFLAEYHPRLIKSEVNHYIMVGGSSAGSAYIDMYAKAGYKFFKDSRCQAPFLSDELVEGDVYMCK